MKTKEEKREHKIEYMKEYNQRPEVIKRVKEYNKEWYQRNRKNELKRMKEYNKNNKDKRKEWCEKNKDKIKEYKKAYDKIYRQKNRDKILKQKKEYHKKPDVIIREREWRESNRENGKVYQRKYKDKRNSQERKRRKTDFAYTIKKRIRSNFYQALKLYSTTGKIMESKDYGVNYKKIIEYLKPFPKDIENYHIDHIIPLSWFNHNDKKEISWAWEPCNLQWLTKEENLIKKDRYILVK